MSNSNARPLQSSDAHVTSLESTESKPFWDVDLRNPRESNMAGSRYSAMPLEFGGGFQLIDSKATDANDSQQSFPLEDATKLIMSLALLKQSSDAFGNLTKPIEDAIEKLLKDLLKEIVDGDSNERSDSQQPKTDPNRSRDNEKYRDNEKSEDMKKNEQEDRQPVDIPDKPKDNHKDDPKEGRLVRVKDSRELESLKIEKNMVIKLEPGANYKISKGLQLPEGASIIGDKGNPPTIDYVGPTVNEKGKNTWPACITVNGKDAVIDGVNIECSSMKYGTKGGANGIWANEGADNLTIKNSSAGKIESFIHLNGADNVRIDKCSADKVNSYFLWNEHGSNNTEMTNSRCDDSVTEWTVRAYGDNLKIDNCTIGNKNKLEGPFKGALALYNGTATVTDSVINSGIRIGPLNGPIHGVQYIDPEHPDKLKPDLTPNEKKSAEILNDKVTKIRASGNKITGWININQNAENVLFENNDIHRPTDAQGEFIASTEYKEEYAGFRKPAEGRFINNRFSGPVDKILHNQPHSKVVVGPGNTLNGKIV